MFASTKGNRGWYNKGRIPLKMSINYININEFEGSIELIVKYFNKGNINYVKTQWKDNKVILL